MAGARQSRHSAPMLKPGAGVSDGLKSKVMKRTKQVRLILTGTMAGGVLVGCGESSSFFSSDTPTTVSAAAAESISASTSFTNNHYVRGMGYYHAAYNGFYPHPHNQHTPGLGYYHGGMYTTTPDNSGIVASKPSAGTVAKAQALHGGTPRGGFGKSTRVVYT